MNILKEYTKDLWRYLEIWLSIQADPKEVAQLLEGKLQSIKLYTAGGAKEGIEIGYLHHQGKEGR